jgi:hypothetical protein
MGQAQRPEILRLYNTYSSITFDPGEVSLKGTFYSMTCLLFCCVWFLFFNEKMKYDMKLLVG